MQRLVNILVSSTLALSLGACGVNDGGGTPWNYSGMTNTPSQPQVSGQSISNARNELVLRYDEVFGTGAQVDQRIRKYAPGATVYEFPYKTGITEFLGTTGDDGNTLRIEAELPYRGAVELSGPANATTEARARWQVDLVWTNRQNGVQVTPLIELHDAKDLALNSAGTQASDPNSRYRLERTMNVHDDCKSLFRLEVGSMTKIAAPENMTGKASVELDLQNASLQLIGAP